MKTIFVEYIFLYLLRYEFKCNLQQQKIDRTILIDAFDKSNLKYLTVKTKWTTTITNILTSEQNVAFNKINIFDKSQQLWNYIRYFEKAVAKSLNNVYLNATYPRRWKVWMNSKCNKSFATLQQRTFAIFRI